MIRLLLLIIFIITSKITLAQCLTDLKKLLPEADSELSTSFSQIAAGGNFMVVGSNQFNGTGYVNAGAAYVFQRTAAGWSQIALITPSNPAVNLQFGNQVAIDSLGETIAVSALGFINTPSAIYIFERPAGGWLNATESDRVPVPDVQLGANAMALGADGLSLAFSAGVYYSAAGYKGIAKGYVFDRASKTELFSSVAWAALDAVDASTMPPALALSKNYISMINPDLTTGHGIISVFKHDKGAGYPKVAALTTPSVSFQPQGPTLAMTDHTIAAVGLTHDATNTTYYSTAFLFTCPSPGAWTDTIKSVPVVLNQELYVVLENSNGFKILNDSTMATSYQYAGSTLTQGQATNGRLVVINRAGKTWKNYSYTNLLDELLPGGYYLKGTYASGIGWNGSQLVTVPTIDSDGSRNVNAITSMTLSNGIWGSKVKVHVGSSSANGFNYGSCVIRSGSNLLVGVQNDSEAGMNAGAVEIYKLDGTRTWIRSGKVLPMPTSEADVGFGYTLAASDSILAVDASVYGPRNFYSRTGKVFLYKRTGADWSSLTPLQTISNMQSYQSFGAALAVSNSVLAFSAVNASDDNQNTLIIYERTYGQFGFSQSIEFGNNLFATQGPGQIKVRGDSIFVFSGASGESGSGTGVFIITKNAAHIWSVASSLSLPVSAFNAVYSLVGICAEVTDDHIFVGAPAVTVNGITNAGSVFVYSKIPGEPWPAGVIQPVATIVPNAPEANAWFGASLSNIENTLVIGAPGNNSYTEPGAAYIFSASDFDWVYHEQIYKFQGTGYQVNERDAMGISVASDKDFYFSGASVESNQQGTTAGAAYTIPTPPLIKQLPPFCKGAQDTVRLYGYPFGGTWSGPGIVDATRGLLDLASLDTGTYMINYLTPNCAFPGKLLIKVRGEIKIEISTANPLTICPSVKSTISIKPITGAAYQWYFQRPSSTEFVALSGATQPDLATDQAGQYYCRVTVAQCTLSSSSLNILYEDLTASVGPQVPVCRRDQTVKLFATPAGGTWAGIQNSNGQFDPNALANGIFPLTYSFTSASGCQYILKDTLIVAQVYPPVLTQLANDFCATGVVPLSVSGNQTLPVTYSWNYSKTADGSFLPIDNVQGQTRSFVARGYYLVIAINEYCTTQSNILQVGKDSILMISNSPHDSTIRVCKSAETTLSATARDNSKFVWYRSDTPTGSYTEVSTGSSLVVSQPGFFKVNGTFGFCTGTTPPQRVTFLPSDSVFVPNVFTPNETDTVNAVFRTMGNITPKLALIVDRSGDEVYRAPTLYWNGQNNKSGVYFWTIYYKDCLNEDKNMKGWVQLVR